MAPEPIGASDECRALLAEVAYFELDRPWLIGRCHQMTVDSYGAQHAGEPTKPIRVAYSLVGLYLALERGLTGPEVRDAHMRVGKPDATWPPFERPPGFAAMTVEDVAGAGVRQDSAEGHAEAIERWACAVWEWWRDAHADVERLTESLLGTWLRSR